MVAEGASARRRFLLPINMQKTWMDRKSGLPDFRIEYGRKSVETPTCRNKSGHDE